MVGLAAADLTVDVECGVAFVDVDVDRGRAMVRDVGLGREARMAQARRRSPRREPAGMIARSSRPSAGDVGPIWLPPPNAPVAAMMICQARPEKYSWPSQRTRQRRGEAVTPAFAAPSV